MDSNSAGMTRGQISEGGGAGASPRSAPSAAHAGVVFCTACSLQALSTLPQALVTT